MKLLIIDDSQMMRKVIERGLAEKKFTLVGSAADGVEGLRIFTETLPDLVTLDIAMPKMDGLTCLVEMRKINKDAKIIILTSHTDNATASDAMARGASGVLGKPFTAAKLIEKVDEVFGK